ncbi:carbon-nitrogen hydrolase family protein [Sphingorhabdus sp.]|jgi:predicted amidohydrolase|uniref:carbon-nitrogen hydrolase family protein n=1 Tax=Sphingorhabdus sp. TaxID=1902408 RepID=UPI0035B4DC20|nr:carbon-nitrogen hydrolase family protein [Sphingomonadaceae bacterium]
MRIAVHQMNSGIDIAGNVETMSKAIIEAASSGARMYFAPEMSVLLDRQRDRARLQIQPESESPAVAALSAAARNAGIWVHAGSVPVISEQDPGRLANRSLLFDSSGQIAARYDKMHLFDVDLATGESWRESSAYIGGAGPVLADTPLGLLGLTICYDMRFPDLYSRLARSGVDALAVPAAFTVPTGKAHWHTLLRARAIEAEAFVIAAAQSGKHADGRETYGHSLVVDPWGEVLLDMGEGENLAIVDLPLERIAEVRAQIPVHLNRRDIPPLP